MICNKISLKYGGSSSSALNQKQDRVAVVVVVHYIRLHVVVCCHDSGELEAAKLQDCMVRGTIIVVFACMRGN